MMNGAGIKEGDFLRTKLWAEAAKEATLRDVISVQSHKKRPAYSEFYGFNYERISGLKTFGEIGTVSSLDNSF